MSTRTLFLAKGIAATGSGKVRRLAVLLNHRRRV
ncbi:LexA family transcriptional regulator [Salmonella enterica]|nr:LexA family transcriptional regulator [Salmonella enterica]